MMSVRVTISNVRIWKNISKWPKIKFIVQVDVSIYISVYVRPCSIASSKWYKADFITTIWE